MHRIFAQLYHARTERATPMLPAATVVIVTLFSKWQCKSTKGLKSSAKEGEEAIFLFPGARLDFFLPSVHVGTRNCSGER